MKMQELRTFTKHSIQGGYASAWGMVFCYLSVWLIMKAVPDCMAVMLLYRKEASPAELFFGSDVYWALFGILWNIVRFCAGVPALYMLYQWFSVRLGFGRTQYFFRDRALFRKSMFFFCKVELYRIMALFPLILFCFLTGVVFQRGNGLQEGGFWLFLTIQCLVLAVWAGVFYLRFCVNLCAVPVLFLENPEISAGRAILISERCLQGFHGKLFWIVFTGGSLPKMFMMLILFLQIRIREYLQEIERGN